MRTITIKAHRVAGYAHGQEVKVEADKGGIPLSPFWQRRLRDADRDQCCEVVVPRRKPTRQKTANEESS